MVKCLELFSGTRSVGKVCDQLGWESVSVDLILEADHECDIMDFDYKQYAPDEFDLIWSSPPCTNYSALKKCWYGRKLKSGIVYTKEQNVKDQNEADLLVLKTLEIINYFNPTFWFMENPQTGNLKNRDIMKDIPFYDVDYCMYSDWGYRKRTRIWTNKKDWEAKLCDNSGSCGNMILLDNDRHLHKTNCGNTEKIQAVRQHIMRLDQIGSGSQKNQKKDLKFLGKGTNRIDRYRVPEDLIFSLFLD